MRQAGTIANRQDAQRFSDYLMSLGITSKVDPAGDQWAIWVHDENELPRSREELEQFRVDPQNARYKDAGQTARKARHEAAARQRKAERNFVDVRQQWNSPWRRRPVTMTLIAMSVVAYLGQSSGNGEMETRLLFSTNEHLSEIKAGELWRLVTPIFLHFKIMQIPFLHLAFNMFWLYDLGTIIERTIGSLWYVPLILAIAVSSNCGQFVMTGSPFFGGMSGVVFGLFGYAWVRGRLDPTCGVYLRPEIVFWMMAWFVLCIVGVIGNVANWAHGVGLATGAACGYLAFAYRRMRKR